MSDQLRLSDADRDRAAAALADHYAEGRLTADEHAERLDRVWAARTRGDLRPVFRDLPGRAPTPRRTPAPAAYRPTAWSTRRGGFPPPLVLVLVVLVGLTVLTHLPVVALGLLAFVFVASRRRRHAGPPRW